MIVLFTGGDELERTKTTLDSLMVQMPENLKAVLEDCDNRLVVFNNTATDPQPQVEDLLRMVERMKMANRSPYVCPKYKKIGEGMEEEIAKRLAVVDERELERQKYVQDLTKQIDEAKEDLRKKKEEFETQEQLRKEEAERLKEHEKKMKEIQEKQLDDEKRRKKEAQEKERLAEDLKNLKKAVQEQKHQKELLEKIERLKSQNIQRKREKQKN
nr:hypothetical protein BaRGS_006630 [Batillaria attramentaria]